MNRGAEKSENKKLRNREKRENRKQKTEKTEKTDIYCSRFPVDFSFKLSFN